MAQYRDYCYADSDKLNFENLKAEKKLKPEEKNWAAMKNMKPI